MPRPSWKPVYLSKEFSQQLWNFKKEKKEIFAYNRASVITQSMTGMHVYVYNGMRFYHLIISSDMLGHRLGEFSPTRKKPLAKKEKFKAQKKGKKK